MASPYTVRKVAAPNTFEHRVYIEQDGQPISPFHDIPLYANQEQTILNMVVEIPRWTNAKLEVCLANFCSAPSCALDVLSYLGSCRVLQKNYPSPSPWASPSPHADILPTRSPRRSSSTPSSRTSRRASFDTSETASPTRVTSGTTVPSPR